MLRLPSAAMHRRRAPTDPGEVGFAGANSENTCTSSGSTANCRKLGDHYDVDSTVLAHGGYSRLHLARPHRGGAQCVVKEVSKYDGNMPVAGQDEASILQSLQHPGVCRCLDVFEDQHNVYLVLEYIEGRELLDEIEQGILDEGCASKIMYQLLLALQYCHENSVIHRDIKPENILVQCIDHGTTETSSVRVKLIDFGLAVRVEQMKKHSVAGTKPYLAPEAFSGQISMASDMWSVGIVLHALLLGRLPSAAIRSGETPLDVQEQIWDVCSISPDARDLVANLLQVDPARRLTAEQALCHPWIRRDFAQPLAPQTPISQKMSTRGKVSSRATLSLVSLQTLRKQCLAIHFNQHGRINLNQIVKLLEEAAQCPDEQPDAVSMVDVHQIRRFLQVDDLGTVSLAELLAWIAVELETAEQFHVHQGGELEWGLIQGSSLAADSYSTCAPSPVNHIASEPETECGTPQQLNNATAC